MKKAKLFGSLTLLTGVALTLAACGNSSSNDTSSVKKMKAAVPTKTAKKGGTVSQAIETDTPFTGIFSNELSTSATDTSVMAPANESLFDTDNTYKYNNKGPATIDINKDAKTVTINIKKGVKWSDGKQVTAKDYEYAYEIIANPDTASQRYTSSLADLEGLEEYHNGKAKTISGLEMPDGENGLKVVLHFKEMKPGMEQSGNGYIWESVAPYHYLKDVPFKKLQSSDQIRKKPLFFGPYKVSKVVRGQSVTYVPNKYYWRGTPKLDKVSFSVVNPNSASQAIKSHKYDIADVVNSQWDQVKNTSDVNFVKQVPLGYSYLGFKVGKWDAKAGKNVMDPNAKMNNKNLRQAIAYGMNIEPVTKRYTKGLSFQVPTLIPKQFGDYFNPDVKAYTQNMKKANKLLDEAGYKKKGKWRTQPNGKPLVIHFAAMSGSSTQEPIIQNYIQQWQKLGLNVKLTSGRLMEFNSFYDKVQNDSSSVDMFQGSWLLSSEPSPNDSYSEKAPFNFSRFVTAKNTQLLDEMDSEKAFNTKYRVDKFHEWQQYMHDEAYVLPMTNAYQVTAVNNKLTGYSTKPADANGLWFKIAYAK
ncbi:oligopeptide ABC transporter substrate-binding protein [Lactobacillus sp. PV034]|uniref:oligopeptide ABC transporter substrate-binding protein n=1 Tax=Lactobacillus sp. PV034 TaxID=2594495 RepID=UPI00223EEC1B|nr:oligopeptide ABC transporter substrate-binding protein [Lactobacillus sp. PV034]QNQ80286.1 oligopeptide ABC transporter substrate-binding protein [Lactobacillus sp. PV034]